MYIPLVAISQMLNYHRRYSNGEADLMKAQLQVLRMQMQPHFLFNTLNSISALIESDPVAAEEMIADLSLMLRTSLKEGGKHEVPLREEFEIVGAYLRIQQKRLGPRLNTDIQIEPEAMNALVPGMILQPLVENAIVHGPLLPVSAGNSIQIPDHEAVSHGELACQLLPAFEPASQTVHEAELPLFHAQYGYVIYYAFRGSRPAVASERIAALFAGCPRVRPKKGVLAG